MFKNKQINAFNNLKFVHLGSPVDSKPTTSLRRGSHAVYNTVRAIGCKD